LQEVLVEKLTQFSQGNNVLDGHASNTDGNLWRGTCASSTQLNSHIWNEESPSAPSETNDARSIPFKLTLLSQGKIVLHAAASNTHGFLWRDTHVPTTQLNRALLNKISISPP
jgi:hypothetical protein